MSELEKMEKYIERTKLPMRVTSPYFMTMHEMYALLDLGTEKEWFDALHVAFNFGMAKGWRAAKKAGRAS